MKVACPYCKEDLNAPDDLAANTYTATCPTCQQEFKFTVSPSGITINATSGTEIKRPTIPGFCGLYFGAPIPENVNFTFIEYGDNGKPSYTGAIKLKSMPKTFGSFNEFYVNLIPSTREISGIIAILKNTPEICYREYKETKYFLEEMLHLTGIEFPVQQNSEYTEGAGWYADNATISLAYYRKMPHDPEMGKVLLVILDTKLSKQRDAEMAQKDQGQDIKRKALKNRSAFM